MSRGQIPVPTAPLARIGSAADRRPLPPSKPTAPPPSEYAPIDLQLHRVPAHFARPIRGYEEGFFEGEHAGYSDGFRWGAAAGGVAAAIAAGLLYAWLG
ncbi:hypothetical protein [Aquincola sp. J276]|uniref:hypothetical protein n=1 Tax=Aquincola sp. J276 TaxID=2898432 RepID=UPI002150C265|nr:hypothetical protein [Aquincola sp. J276]MCR5864673.1 hypothetical protein [Aquincola sp. J276]